MEGEVVHKQPVEVLQAFIFSKILTVQTSAGKARDHWPGNPGGSQATADNFLTQTLAAGGDLLLDLLLTNGEMRVVKAVTGQPRLQQLQGGCSEPGREARKASGRERIPRLGTDFSFLRSSPKGRECWFSNKNS